jgi:hypothetical protein
VIDSSAQRWRAEGKKQKLIMTTMTTKQWWMIVAAAALAPGWTAQFFGTTMTLFVAAQPSVRFLPRRCPRRRTIIGENEAVPLCVSPPHIHQLIVISSPLYKGMV